MKKMSISHHCPHWISYFDLKNTLYFKIYEGEENDNNFIEEKQKTITIL